MSDSSSRSASPDPSFDRPYIATRRHRSRAHVANDNDVPPEQLQATNLYTVDVLQWKDDDLCFRSAAAQSGLPYDRVTELELKTFGCILKNPTTLQLYLFCRNKMLVLWNNDPLVELTSSDAIKEIPPPFNSDAMLIRNIHAFLQRYSYINFGIAINLSRSFIITRPKVIVIGAGVSGMAAARQLHFFGFDVKILEGRGRTGGRVFSYKVEGHIVNLGAQIITGIVGNPIITLAKQLPVNLIRVNQRCPLFSNNGKLVDSRKDNLIQNCFNEMLQTCAFIAHGLGITEVNGRKLSLGKTFDAVLNQQELHILEKRLEHYKKALEVGDVLQQLNRKLLVLQMTITACVDEMKKLVDINTANSDDIFRSYEDVEDEENFNKALHLRQLRQELILAIEAYDDTEKERAELTKAFTEFRKMEPRFFFVLNGLHQIYESLFSTMYLSIHDKQILDFHIANLEYGIGAPVNSASLKYWDHDDDFGFEGSHLMVLEGYHDLIRQLSADVPLQLRCNVKEVCYMDYGVEITYSRTPEADQNEQIEAEIVTEQADAVLCTVPLGVLKASIMNPSMDSAIQFTPPLPQWKREAITSLGYGSLNKVVLVFEHMFWDSTLHTFGRLNDTVIARGELFLFLADGKKPVLTGLLAGNSANCVDTTLEDQLIVRAMNILQNIFGSACPKHPLNHVITLWHSDPFSLGCYSYVSTNATSKDYDTLAAPLAATEGEKPRLFFAGEHTNREHTATVHGAFLSGTRAAAEIANAFLGPVVM